jgi:hypothetical protein
MARPSILALIACAALGSSYLVSTDASAAGRGGSVSIAPPVASQTLAPGPGAFAPKRPSVTTTTTTRVPTEHVGPTYQGASLPDDRGTIGFAVGGGKTGLGAGSNLNNSGGDAQGAIGQDASALSGIAAANAASERKD